MDLLTSESPRALQPTKINLELKDHQRASLYRMLELDQTGGLSKGDTTIRANIGILGDHPGYGKTITFLALVASLQGQSCEHLPLMSASIIEGHGIIKTTLKKTRHINTSLIVTPNNLVLHWKTHLDQYTELSFETVTAKAIRKIMIEEYDIILCPCKYYNDFLTANQDYCWNRVAFDEADTINIPNTVNASARFVWLITATYARLPYRRNRGFLSTICSSAHYNNNLLLSILIQGQDNFVKQSFNLLEPTIENIFCSTPAVLGAIKGAVSDQVRDLMNAGDLNGAILALGGQVDNDRNILDLVTRNIKNDITIVTGKIETLTQLDLTENERYTRERRLREKLSSLQERKQQLETAIQDVSKNDCPICYATLSAPTVIPCCNVIFCASCLLTWLQHNFSCPMCRERVQTSELHTISTEVPVQVTRRRTKRLTKIQTILNLIRRNSIGKFLVCSGYVATFQDIGRILRHEGIEYGVLSSDLQTMRSLDLFNSGDIRVILLDAKHNGAGIDISGASDVILYHAMDVELEKQAVARAQRPGRTEQLRVWRLRYESECQ
jgi:hypothetical protein